MKRKEVSKKTRIAITLLLAIITITPAIVGFAFTPIGEKIITEEITTCSYNQRGLYHYTTYLKENTLYNNSTVQPQNEKNIFKEITDHINMSFNFLFYSDCVTLMTGFYRLDFQIITEHWKKEYNIIPEIRFGPNQYLTNFKINISKYEEIFINIEEELDLNSKEAYLVINSNISLSLLTEEGEISEIFNPILKLSLKESVINISENLSQSKTESFTETIEIPISEEEINNERNNYIIIAIIFLVILILFLVSTKNQSIKPSEEEKQITKTLKKYKEWIIEINQPIKKSVNIDIIKTKSLDDLIKTSEELGKPVIHYISDKNGKHMFYIIDDKTRYEHNISSKQNIEINNEKQDTKSKTEKDIEKIMSQLKE